MTIKFKDTRFWKNYSAYDRAGSSLSMRATVDSLILWKLLTSFKFNNFLDIGTYQGLTAGLFLESCQDSRVTSIDMVDHLDLFRRLYPDYIDRFTFINQPSQTVDLKNNLYDFIFLDGDTSYEGFSTDLKNCLPQLKTTGILAMDNNPAWAGRINAVNNLHNLKTDWVPFLKGSHSQFWHHRSVDRGEFLDSLFTDPISNFIFIRNTVDEYKNIICCATTLNIFTSTPKYFNLALQEFDI